MTIPTPPPLRAGRLLRPWHPASPIPVWLLGVLLILAAHNAVQFVAAGPGPDQIVDFRPLYLGAGILLDGGNPYDDLLLKRSWIDVARREGFTGLSMPGLPRTPLLYPPWALPLFVPFQALPWLAAVPVWYALLPVLLVAAVVLLAAVANGCPRVVPVVDLLALAVAFKAIDWAVVVGQPMFLCLALGIASWALSVRDRGVSAGIALGLAAFKIHLVLPFALLAVFRRRYRVLVAAAATVAVLIGIFLVLCDHPAASVASLVDNLTEHSRITYDPTADGYPLSRRMVWNTSLTALAEFFVQGAWHHWAAIDAVLVAVLLPVWFKPLARRRVSDARAFSILAVVDLLAFPHFHYDCLVLLPLYLLARETNRSERIALLAAGAVFLTPINGLLALFNVPEALGILYLNVQLGLIATAVVLSWGAATRPRVEPMTPSAAGDDGPLQVERE